MHNTKLRASKRVNTTTTNKNKKKVKQHKKKRCPISAGLPLHRVSQHGMATYTRKINSSPTTNGGDASKMPAARSQNYNKRLPFADIQPGYFTLDAPMPGGKHKGQPLSELPMSYVSWLNSMGVTYYREDLLKCFSQLGQTPYYKPFEYTQDLPYRVDAAIHSRFEQLLEPELVPAYFGVGRTMPFNNVNYALAKLTHTREIVDKLFKIKSLLWQTDDVNLPALVESELNTLYDLFELTQIGKVKLPRIPQWSEIEAELQRRAENAGRDAILTAADGSLGEVITNTTQNETLEQTETKPKKKGRPSKKNAAAAATATANEDTNNNSTTASTEDDDAKTNAAIQATIKAVDDTIHETFDADETFMDQLRASKRGPGLILDPTTGLKRLTEEEQEQQKEEKNGSDNNNGEQQKLGQRLTTFVKTPPGAAAQREGYGDISSRIVSKWKKLLNEYTSVLYEDMTTGFPSFDIIEKGVNIVTKTDSLLKTEKENNNGNSDNDNNEQVQGEGGTSENEQQIIKKNRRQKILSNWIESALLEDRTLLLAQTEARLTTSSLIHVPRPIIPPIYKHSSGITFRLTQQQKQALEPYMEVPEQLPSNFVFWDTTHINTNPNTDSDFSSQHITQISAIDGIDNIFNVNIQPNNVSFGDLPHINTDKYVRDNYQRYWSPQSVQTEVGYDSFFQWLYHPTSGRKPTQRLINPDYKDKLSRMKLFAKLRIEVDSHTITYDELQELPDPVKKLFTQQQQQINMNKTLNKKRNINLPKISYNYLTGILTANGVQAQVNSKGGIKSNDLIDGGDGFVYVTKKRGWQTNIDGGINIDGVQDVQLIDDDGNLIENTNSNNTNNTSLLTNSSNSLSQQQKMNSIATEEKIAKQRDLFQEFLKNETASNDSTNTVEQQQQRRKQRLDPVIMIGWSLPKKLRQIDTELRHIDYKYNNNNLGGLDPNIIEKATINSRYDLLERFHRDNQSNNLRNVMFNNGNIYIDTQAMLPFLFQTNQLEKSAYGLRAVHAALTGMHRSIYGTDSALTSLMLKDLYFTDNIAGAFFRAELDRIYNSIHQGNIWTSKEYTDNGEIYQYPNETWLSQGNNFDFNFNQQEQKPKRFNLFTNSYIDDINTIKQQEKLLSAANISTNDNKLNSSQAKELHKKYFIYNTIMSPQVMITNGNERLQLETTHLHTPHATPSVKSSNLLGGGDNDSDSSDEISQDNDNNNEQQTNKQQQQPKNKRIYGDKQQPTDVDRLRMAQPKQVAAGAAAGASVLPGVVGSTWTAKPKPNNNQQQQETRQPTLQEKPHDPTINGDIPVTDF